MPINRRKLILGAAGTAVLVGTGGLWRVTRMPQSASTPWDVDPMPLDDPRLDAFRYAILAPNPHNRQPWQIRLDGPDSALLFCDLEKRLPETDPFDRQIVIGFGTFIELAALAAARRGLRLEVQPFPAGEPQPRLNANPVARLTFKPDATIRPDLLFDQITKRRTNRNIYARTPPSEPLIKSLTGDGVHATSDPGLLTNLRAITVAAITTEMVTHRTHMESVRLMRIGYEEVDARPDGLSLTGPMIETTKLLGLTSRATIADPSSTSFKIGLEDLRETYGSVPAAAWIITDNNGRANQIAAGRRYARLHLQATALGLALHPLSQSLQEYPEIAKEYQAVHKLLGAQDEQCVQMLARIGTAPPVPPAARFPLQNHIIA